MAGGVDGRSATGGGGGEGTGRRGGAGAGAVVGAGWRNARPGTALRSPP
uniref:Uncharacterized protein n=1 Tax=Arundo donax TaxID=35708 RepID=A0A0A8Y9C5_ARUDO